MGSMQSLAYQGVTTYDDFSGQCFRIFEIICFVAAICDLVHDVDTIHDLC